jgi:hypothetical protein
MTSSGHVGYASATTSFFGEKKHSRIGGPEAWTVWILATIFVVWLFAIQTGYGIVSPDIQKSANLTLSQISSAASVYTVAFALCQFFLGVRCWTAMAPSR